MAKGPWNHSYKLRSGKHVYGETTGGWVPFPRGTLLTIGGERYLVGPATVDPMRRQIVVRVYHARDVEALATTAKDLRARIAAHPGQVLMLLQELFGSTYAVAALLDLGERAE